MCKSSDRHEFLLALPKCEHHLHIEGTLRPELMFQLAERNGITLPKDDPAFESEDALLARYDKFTSLDDFLHYYYAEMAVLITAHDFEDLAWDYFTRAASEGVVHTELSFDPQAHLARGVAFSTIVSGLTAARARAEKELGISTHLILCLLRHLPVESALELLDNQEVQSAMSAGLITGVGLVSSEVDFPNALFESVFQKAKALGVRLTAHAGEEGPASNIDAALRLLGVERIDHGIALRNDPELMARIAQRGIMLTVCPVSNVRLKAVPNIKSSPIRKFLDAGVRFSINSDDPSYFGAYIQGNFCAVQDAFELSVDEWELICANAIDGSWCSEQRKTELLKRLDDVKKQHI